MKNKVPAFGLCTLVIVGLVSLFQRVGVLFGSACLLALVLVVVFVSSDGSPLLHAQEAENRFWTVVAMLLSTAVFFSEDSPLRIGAWSPLLGIGFVLACTLWISWYDRWLRRRRLSRSLHFSKATSLFGRIDESIDALARVDEALRQLDHYYIPSTITRVWRRREVVRLERVVIETLQDATADELNALLCKVKLGLLVYKLKDEAKIEGARTDLVELLAVQRVADLNVYARVALLDALQQMPLAAHPRAERWVRNVIVWTKADDLTDLKTLTDAKGDIHSFHRLVYVDVTDPQIREDILNHIAREAKIHAAHRLLATRVARERALKAPRGDRKVLSDIDDTLLCSGGHYPAGVDARWPRKTAYPGVLALYRELDLGVKGLKDDWDGDRLGNLVFLSARPHVYADLMERSSYTRFADLVSQRRLHAMPTMLVGDLKSGGEMMMLGDMEPLAQKKAKNFTEFASLYPEFTFVFLGDNGQGDVRAAELMYEHSRSQFERAYIHVVQPIEKTHHRHASFEDAKNAWDASNVVFVDTFLDAAIDAATNQLIRPQGLRRVAIAALSDLDLVKWPPETSDSKKKERREELDAALERTNRVLQTSFGLDPVVPLKEGAEEKPPKPPRIRFSLPAPGSAVKTPMGGGILLRARRDGIAEVALDWRLASRQPAIGFFDVSTIA
ncbi:hypothetical protein CTAYLR_003577 [Chrysophaeum taylorii]|uniref:Phosphatidate phosphatase APP1 catalytic domain-containing protein n=1 Tax=Chrysophaeum taylorii TaxID=2483200 RepID=A0AAD7UKY9_9STRA|nr:hypothetical protein CTAYLR_003577 [Chrysophaeum taylorii]